MTDSLVPEQFRRFVERNQKRFNSISDILIAIVISASTVDRLRRYDTLVKELRKLEEDAVRFGIRQVDDWSIDQKKTFGQQLGKLVREKFTAKILALADTLKYGRIPGVFNLGIGVHSLNTLTPQQRMTLIDAIRAHPIVILSGVRHRRFSADYYFTLVLYHELSSLRRDSAIKQAIDNGSHLVQISPQPSTIGDYCDLYKGRVFSVKGAHPDFPPLTDCPNGGAPLHPWCRHFLIPLEPDSPAIQKALNLPPIPREFVEAARSGASPNKFMQLWQTYKNQFTP